MSDNPEPDAIAKLLDAALAEYAAVAPPPGAEVRWRAGLRQPTRAESFLGWSARAWAAACMACLFATLALGWLVLGRAAAVAPVLVVSPPPPPVFTPASTPASTPAGTTAAPRRDRATAAGQSYSSAVPVYAPSTPLTLPASIHTVAPTAEEALLIRMVALHPAAVAAMLKDSALSQPPPSQTADPSAVKGEF